MTNTEIEMGFIKIWRSKQSSIKWVSRKRLDTMLNNSRKKTRSFCKRHGGFYICKNCKGSGFDTSFQTLSADFGGYTVAHLCESCNALGVTTWLDKMIGGWK